MTIKDIPAEWQKVLGELQERYSHVVIGGGAIRDLENDRPIKDVDIWVIDDTVLKGSSPVFGADIEMSCAASSGASLKNISRVEKLSQYGIDFDVIFTHSLKDIDDLLEYFLDNISRVAYDGNRIIRHASYIVGHNTKTIVVDWEKNNTNSEGRVEKRINKLKGKYSDYTLVEKNRL